MSKLISTLVCACALLVSKIPHAEEFVRFVEGQEIQVRVPFIPNVDKTVYFEEPVAVGVTPSFKEAVRVQVIGQNVYFTARSPIERTFRISAKGQRTQKTYILTVKITKSQTDAEALRIVSSEPRRTSDVLIGGKTNEVTPVELLRFVSQSLFAPKYAIEPLKGVRAVPLSLPDNLDWLYEGNSLSIKPLIAFKAGRWTVTALSAVNKSEIRGVSVLNMMNIYSRVEAYGAVAQHKSLGVTPDDNSTVIYVVTEGDLANFMRVGG
jgi:integrating conjugative element protein (TIGR03749 family)